MLRKLAVPPSWAVTRAGSALTSRPAADHVMVIGGSPRTTEQMIWARSPSLRIGLPKLKGTISGGSRETTDEDAQAITVQPQRGTKRGQKQQRQPQHGKIHKNSAEPEATVSKAPLVEEWSTTHMQLS
jgi:hypothetical protein